jgi:hypothetical protein
MSQPAWRAKARHLPPLVLLLVASVSLAEPVTVDPETTLSLDFSVRGVTPCFVVPEKLYEPAACAGIPRREASASPGDNRSMRALVVLREGEQVLVVTVASLVRPEIGQMSEPHIQAFIQSTLKNLSEDSGALVHPIAGAQKAYTVERVGGVPVVRWEYTTDFPDEDLRANTASAVVYLIPSRDTLDLVSFNAHRKDLDAARGISEQVLATLKVPLTIDAETFGTPVALGMGAAMGGALVSLVIAFAGVLWLWTRYRKSRGAPQ